jgi:hypothetical protein
MFFFLMLLMADGRRMVLMVHFFRMTVYLKIYSNQSVRFPISMP